MDNDITNDKLAKSLTADTTDIIPFLPYLLQDLWELGSSGQEMLVLLRRYIPITTSFTALDLGCGKGAVSVTLAKALGIHFKAIDLIGDFIREACEKAAEYGVDGLCEFAVGDIKQAVRSERNYDLAIFGAVGDVIGDRAETLRAIMSAIRPGGYILLDDGYRLADDDSTLLFDGEYPTLTEWQELYEKSGLLLLAYSPAEDRPNDDRDFECISQRAQELIREYPQHREMFEHYAQNQRDEYADLAQRVIGVTFLLQKPSL